MFKRVEFQKLHFFLREIDLVTCCCCVYESRCVPMCLTVFLWGRCEEFLAPEHSANVWQYHRKITKILFKNNLKVAFKSLQIIEFDKMSSLPKSGIPRLNCTESNSCWIGQTELSFPIRFKEYCPSYILNKYHMGQ